MKQLSIVTLKSCSYVRVSLCRLHMPNALGVRNGFDVDTSHIFPHHVLVTITLVGSVACYRGSRICAGCEAGFPFCSVAVITLLVAGSSPKLLKWKP